MRYAWPLCASIELTKSHRVQINSTSELILTELILENTLASYTPEETVALLSAFVFQEKTDVDVDELIKNLPQSLKDGKHKLESIADRVGRIQDRHKVVAAEFQTGLKFGLMEVVYEWARGMVCFLAYYFLEIPSGANRKQQQFD